MEGLKCKNGKRSQKWVFIVLAKHGLNKTWDKSNFGLILEYQNRKERRRGRGREEEEKRREKPRSTRYGTLDLCMNLWDFCMDFYDFGMDIWRFVWIYGCGLRVVRNLTLE